MPNLKDLSRDLRQFKRDMVRAAERANARIGDGARAVARAYSSGSVRSLVLQTPLGVTHHMNPITGKITKLREKKHGGSRGLGAPYGHGAYGFLGPRGPIPYGDAGWINKQTGEFYRSWRLARGSTIGGAPCLILSNISDHAKFLESGTSKMVRRPIDEHIRGYIDQVAPAIFKEEFDRAWTARFDTK